MFGKVRKLGRRVQAMYEKAIACRTLFGFTDLYIKAMSEVKRKDQELHKEGD